MFTQELIQVYLQLLPTAGYIMASSLILTPIVGYFAHKYHFIDLPAIKRKRTDKSLAQRIHKKTKPRLGGLAYLMPILFLLFSEARFDQAILGMAIGLLILLIVGALDDRYELPAKNQLIAQLVAAVIVVIMGVKIIDINIGEININFDIWHRSIDLGYFELFFMFPADLITVLWIMVIINAVNWMYGMDAIGESMAIIASVTTGLLSVRAGLLGYSLISFSLAGGLLGFLPFNIYPSKILGGTAGSTGSGFLLAILSILSGAKFNNAIMLLLFPLFDMVWVVIYRIRTHKDEPFLKRPFISGKVHFHHRLMTLGLSQRQILIVETILIAAISILGIYISGFSNTFLFLISAIAGLILIFTIVSFSANRKEKRMIEDLKKSGQDNFKETESRKEDDIPPEQRYAY